MNTIAPRKVIAAPVVIADQTFKALMDEQGNYFVPVQVLEAISDPKAEDYVAFIWYMDQVHNFVDADGTTYNATTVNFYHDALLVQAGLQPHSGGVLDTVISIGLMNIFNDAFRKYRHAVTRKPIFEW
jgi:hypothetical protein